MLFLSGAGGNPIGFDRFTRACHKNLSFDLPLSSTMCCLLLADTRDACPGEFVSLFLAFRQNETTSTVRLELETLGFSPNPNPQAQTQHYLSVCLMQRNKSKSTHSVGSLNI